MFNNILLNVEQACIYMSIIRWKNSDPNHFKNPTVQDIIDSLRQIKVKDQLFEIEMIGDDGFCIDYSSIEIHENTKTNGHFSSVWSGM